jgi:Flp pilus assembly protein TadG
MGGVRQSRGRERGAALVEMALVLPLLLMLLLGIVSAGLAYNHQLALTHAAREAGRYGATLSVTAAGGMNNWLTAVSDRAVSAATGSLDPGTPGLYVCVAYVSGGSAPNDTTTRIEDGTITSDTCFTDGRPANERRVQVRVERDVDFNALVFQTTLTLDSEAVNRFEAALGGP